MNSPKKSKAKPRDTEAEPIQSNLAPDEAAARLPGSASMSENVRAGTADDECAEADGKESPDPSVLASIRRDRRNEVVARLKASRRGRGDRPLAQLATKEVELRETSTARAHLVAVQNKAVDPTLLGHQLSGSVDTPYASAHVRKQMRSDARRLYSAFESGDPVESIIDRVLVASTNVTLSCYERATLTQRPEARQVELRWAMKGAEVIGNLIKLRDLRRGAGPQNVTVGSVNVEPGGQAIVGNVTAKKIEDEG